MSFADIFRELIKIETCQVVCWTDSNGFAMEYTEIPILAKHSEKFYEWTKQQFIESDTSSVDEELDAYAQDMIENAVAFRPPIASENTIQIAANLQIVIKKIENALDVAKKEFLEVNPTFSPEQADIELDSAKWNLNLIKDFCDYYVADRYGAIDNFWVFRSYIQPGNNHLYDIPVPGRYKDGIESTYGETVDFRRACNISNYQVVYLVSNLYEYCFALLDFLTNHKCRLERCKRCGRFYVPFKGIRNSKYCNNIDWKVGKSCLELSKSRELTDIHKKIYNRLRIRNGPDADEQLRSFLDTAAEHRRKVKQREESIEEYMQWLEQQDECTRKRSRKSS